MREQVDCLQALPVASRFAPYFTASLNAHVVTFEEVAIKVEPAERSKNLVSSSVDVDVAYSLIFLHHPRSHERHLRAR